MPFQKGHKGFKPKGAKSEKIKAWDELGAMITGEHTERVNTYLEQLFKTDKEAFFKAYTLLLEYFKPKQARTELTGSDGKDLIPETYDLSKLSKQTLKELLDAIEAPDKK